MHYFLDLYTLTQTVIYFMLIKDNVMINNAIAFASRRIPYIPELRSYCKSVTACILMTQLEYRFSSMPDGFYKFLSPCDHYAYKLKDSWTEELGFSEDEFRSAIDHIAVRYLSKTKLQEAINSGKDPFQGKCYLVYRDVVNGLTYYLRNHEVVNTVIEDVLRGYQPESTQETPQECFKKVQQSSQTRKSNFQKLAKPVSIPGKIPSSYTEHKMTTKEDSSSSELTSCQEYDLAIKKTSIAAAELSSLDSVIQSKLTPVQAQYVSELARIMAGHLKMDEVVLNQHISTTILDPQYFNKAGEDFFRKYNSIRKAMLNGTWTPPAALVIDEVKKDRTIVDEIKLKITELTLDVNHAKKMINTFVGDSPKEIWGAQINSKENEINNLMMELGKYQT